MRVVIIGHGVVGSEVERKMKMKNIDKVFTIDIDPQKNADYLSLNDFYKDYEQADVYIISVWKQKQVLDVIKQIKLTNKPLISMETTCEVGTFKLAKEIVDDKAYLINFQERIYPNDEFHSIFNQKRVMGGDWKQGREFYLRYMIYENIVVTDNPEIAELSHIVDNSFRYISLAVAEELKMLLNNDFEELRRLVNTKWNIEIPEARDGIGGHCLPKDIKLFNNQFPKNKMFNLAEQINNNYKKMVRPDEIKKQSILVTGGAGFIGQHLVKELSEEFKIIVLDNLSSGKPENISEYDVDFVKRDICDEKVVEGIMKGGIDYVFHLAAQVSVEKSVKDPMFDAKTNILGTINLLKQAEKYGVKKFIYFSSSAVYGKPQYLPIDETHPTEPLSQYGLSKLIAEKYCLLSKTPVVILRLFNVYGPGQQIEYAGVISKFIDDARKNNPSEIFGDGHQYRDFIYVDDVVKASKLALEHNGIFNIGSGVKTTINDLVEKICFINRKELKIIFREKRIGDIEESISNIEKAKKTLGWKPSIELDTGLTELFCSGRPDKNGDEKCI